MEANLRWVLVTAIAPVAWGSNYYVTHEFLPADQPFWGGLLRALPAGLLLLLVCRRLPRGRWWWRSLVLGTLNVGAFFVLIYVAAQLLPTSIAATVMATSPVVMMLFAWWLVASPPAPRHVAGALLGIAGVALLLFTGVVAVDVRGVLASVAAMTMSSLGYVLAKRWGTGGPDVLSLTAWQLVAGGLVLAPVAVVVEGAPPALDGPALWGFAYVAVVATALAFVAWFAGLRHLEAGTVGLVGLLNPVTGVLLGVAVAGESLGVRQLCGLALVFAGIVLGRVSRRVPSGSRPAEEAITVANTPIDDDLWDEFHRVVNMSSRELSDWLRVRSSDTETEELPDHAGTETGQHVLAILRKRKTDVDDDDIRVMRNVVDRIHSERRDDLEPTPGEAHWRHRLMTIGHDPLKG